MLEENVAYEDGASVYRAGYNPAFIAQARKNNFQRDLERLERELAAARRQIDVLRDENASLRLQCEMVLSARPVDADSLSVDDLHSMGRKVSVKDIIRVIANKHGVSAGEILGPRRSRDIIAARFEAIALARKLRPELSLPQLGRQFNRDHTSILAALRRMGVS